jgi:hypothetical protein
MVVGAVGAIAAVKGVSFSKDTNNPAGFYMQNCPIILIYHWWIHSCCM